jgi:hypothetical protein
LQVADTPESVIATKNTQGVLGFAVVWNTTSSSVASSNDPVQVDVQLNESASLGALRLYDVFPLETLQLSYLTELQFIVSAT